MSVIVGFGPGETITREGDRGDAFYFDQGGESKVVAGGWRKGLWDRGGYFGEISVVDGGPRTDLGGHLRKFRDIDWSPTGPSSRWQLRRAASGSER